MKKENVVYEKSYQFAIRIVNSYQHSIDNCLLIIVY